MFRISKDSPAYYVTSVAKDRLPVFRTTELNTVACAALDEARRSAVFLLFAYVLMPDHIHAIVGSELKPSRVLQYINGIISRRVIDFLRDNGHQLSLEKLRHGDRGRGYRYSLWDHHPNAKLLTTEDLLMQKVNYVHQNPVRAGLSLRPKIIAGQVFAFGKGAHWRMNLYSWILTRFSGDEAQPRLSS